MRVPAARTRPGSARHARRTATASPAPSRPADPPPHRSAATPSPPPAPAAPPRSPPPHRPAGPGRTEVTARASGHNPPRSSRSPAAAGSAPPPPRPRARTAARHAPTAPVAARTPGTSARPSATAFNNNGISTYTEQRRLRACSDGPSRQHLSKHAGRVVDFQDHPNRKPAVLTMTRPSGQPAPTHVLTASDAKHLGPRHLKRRSTGGGTADSSAWRTVRRCTPCLSASARIDNPSTR